MIANPNDGNSPRVEAATPIIDVSAEGLITATTEQEAGYVPGGSKSATQQLPTQAAKTVTPGTTTQTAVASGRYTTGAVQVAGDANLKAENIAEGVSIFGVTGTHSGLKEITGKIVSTGSYITNWLYMAKTGPIDTYERSLPGIVAPTLLLCGIPSDVTFAMTGGIERIDDSYDRDALFYVTDDFTLSVTS